ncbi:uncharacterized protein SPPG_05052 [Spizellomyces punctatus DAOM BR117]|uniref:Pyruvate phosphate dikinase AMP/ATP-binding domain-containing protein n=1 Tax=Spizellomyces punctatus (strain DAOM BR117) TaxID=645134 RepID=A0A0L0HDZ4_SPIPD|nr:uncharacterized protein SPPG_05052 [Spizellomyces punctatus DAOM BR117]KNC99670.1 hypothetical protein SPPG_05052 [Spizellomyces punctatus DAOM BR117]|eukprot:XP_016607710.1 hypothetical protein SPPG_05052 [Spizellomyces punctatus DAOM BR117]
MRLAQPFLLLVALCTYALAAPLPESTGYLSKLNSLEDFDSIATNVDSGSSNSNFGKATKFLIDNRNAQAPVIYFINANGAGDEHQYHYYFAAKYLKNFNRDFNDLDVFNDKTYFSQEKSFYAGVVRAYTLQNQTFVGFQFYPQDVLKEQTILHAARVVRNAAPTLDLRFVATGSHQTVATIKQQLDEIKVPALQFDAILGDVTYAPIVQGTSYGILRLRPAEDATTPRDIVILDVLPLYLSVLSGVITTQFQDANSHVSLKSRERGTPDCYLKSASTDPAILALVGKPVKFTVGPSKATIEAATQEEVDDYHEALNAKRQPIVMNYDKTFDQVVSYDTMCPRSNTFVAAAACMAKKNIFGSKAANLAFLAHPTALGRATEKGTLSEQYGYDLSPEGFGIPFKFYDDLVNLPENANLKKAIESLQASVNQDKLAKAELTKAVADLQKLFYAAKIPQAVLDKVNAAAAALATKIGDPKLKLKFRSSASAEDIEGFDGAGLYSSFSAKIHEKDTTSPCTYDPVEDEMNPKRIDCALRGVYASLYNVRGIEERRFARIEGGITMGIAVVPKYARESPVLANSVVVTKIQDATQRDLAGYTIGSQELNGLVTNPEPGTLSEMTWAIQAIRGRPVAFNTLRQAVPKPGGPARTSRVLTDQQLTDTVKITQKLEITYCAAKAGGNRIGACEDVPFEPVETKEGALDLEVKYLENGHYVFKQIREFHG